MTVLARLSLLQALQNVLYASTAIALGTYLLRTLDFSGREVGLAYATTAIAATAGPPLTGWLADRRFRPDRMLVWMNLAAALALVGCFFATTFPVFYGCFLLFNISFMPTFALVNAVCFHQLERPVEQFPIVRMWGTVGFMLVGLSLSALGWEPTPWPLLAAAGVAIASALFSLTLDPIPPQPNFTWSDLKGEEVQRIVREPGMLVLMLAMFLSCIPSSFYYSFVNPFLNEVGWSAAAAKMSLGQFGEIFVLLAMPFVLRHVRFRRVVFWGLLLWGLRYIAFAYGRPGGSSWLLYAGILVQGFCFVWIVVAAQIYVDNRVPKALRSTAQGLIVFANQGAGILLGSWIAGEVVQANGLPGGGHDWTGIWWAPAIVGIIAALLFWWWFPRAGRV